MLEQDLDLTVLRCSTLFKGDLLTDGDVRIQGRFEGTLETDGMIEICEGAQIIGTVIAGAVRIAGQADGDIVGLKGVAVLDTGSVSGRIFTKRLMATRQAKVASEICTGPEVMQLLPNEILKRINEPESGETREITDSMNHPTAVNTDQPLVPQDRDYSKPVLNSGDDMQIDPAPVIVPAPIQTVLRRKRRKGTCVSNVISSPAQADLRISA